MKGAALRGGAVLTVLCGLFVPVFAQETQPTPELVVTDADRLVANFTREAAVLADRELRMEISGFSVHKYSDVRLNLIGYSMVPHEIKIGQEIHSLNGGFINLLGSYGLGGNIEGGVNIPILFQTLTPEEGASMSNAGIGDFEMYAKFRREVYDHLDVGAGMELFVPTGSAKNGLGTGEVGTNPFVSARYTFGRVATGIHAGYLINAGDFPNVFNWDWDIIARANKMFSLRCEITGRQFDQRGDTFSDITIMPGANINLTDNFVIRPSGLTHLTDQAIGWGIGVGFAYTLGLERAAPPPPPPAVVQAPPPPPPVKQKIVLRGVNFDFAKADIRADARPILDEAARLLKEDPSVRIAVEGYTDSIGSEAYNLQLSIRRAEAVRDYLVSQGIASDRMTDKGFGKADPVASNETADGRAQNRRVELRVLP